MFFLAAALALTPPAHAVDEDLPPPAGSEGSPQPPLPPGNPLEEENAEDETLPSPSLGGDALPEPSDQGAESGAYQVNRAPEDDEIYLPTPNNQDGINYAPVGTPAPRFTTAEDIDWRTNLEHRPAFSLYTGLGYKGYKNVLVKGYITGPSVGASYRVISLGQTLFAHAYFGMSWYSVGDVGSISDVRDETMQLGGLLELALGRRFSVHTSFMRRTSLVKAKKFTTAEEAANHPRQDVRDLEDVGEPVTYYLGIGARYDFYVIPHASIGAIAHFEQDLFMLSLAFSFEPMARRKLNLNFSDMPR